MHLSGVWQYPIYIMLNINTSTLTSTSEFWCSGRDFNMVSKQFRFNSYWARI